MRPYLKKNPSQKGAGGVPQGVGPAKKERKKKYLIEILSDVLDIK
jgi:hypothetical protein